MIDYNFIFIHGWGMDSSIWQDIAKHFPKEQSHFIDLGFTNNDKVANIPVDNDAIFITHSLGTLWALKHCAHNMSGLVAINGFTNFTEFIDTRTLRTMQKNLKRTHNKQMQEFWNIINIDYNNKNLNINNLHEGLEWLINWDIEEEFNNFDIPTLSLIGDKDPLLPTIKMKKQWVKYNIEIIQNGGHILPLSHPEKCVQKIKDFIIEYKLEK